jgi:hypothetical protein
LRHISAKLYSIFGHNFVASVLSVCNHWLSGSSNSISLCKTAKKICVYIRDINWPKASLCPSTIQLKFHPSLQSNIFIPCRTSRIAKKCRVLTKDHGRKNQPRHLCVCSQRARIFNHGAYTLLKNNLRQCAPSMITLLCKRALLCVSPGEFHISRVING